MKRIILLIFLFVICYFPCLSQAKTVDIYFNDSVKEQEVNLHYSIYGLLNPFYEPYINTQQAIDNHFLFEIPDSITTFLIELSPSAPFQWGKNIVLLMKPKEKLTIYLDSVQPAKFEGDNVNLHYFMYKLKNGTGTERAEHTLNEFLKDSAVISFYNFINQKIAMNIMDLDSLLVNRYIDTVSYTFAKNQTIDDYLFRAALIGLRQDTNYFSKIDSIHFYNDLNKLFVQYENVYDWGISSTYKANLKAMKLISSSKLDLGLDSIYIYNSYLKENEQEPVSAFNIIVNTAVGQLDSLLLNNQRKKYKEVFPLSIYNLVLDQLKPLDRKDYILASYSKKDGFNEYGRFKVSDLKNITGMFIGGRPVFVDFWATWCGPCIQEFSYMKGFEEFAKEHNIGILYVSHDFAGNYNKWKQRIVELQLEGLHYLGGQEFASYSYFKNDKSIPRYVLINKDGVTLIDKCELPSSGKLIQQIKEKLEIR